MAKQTKTVHKKSRGRPSGQRYAETIPARLEPSTVAAVDDWATANDVSRSEAIRRLVEIGLSTGKPQAQTPVRTSAEAKRLAGRALNGLADPRASTVEQADRKQDLIKGPEEFRSMRVDHRNKK
jgi:hypothetical protein